MRKYNLKDFDEFLLANDVTVKDMGWIMVSKAFDIKRMTLDELTYLKLELGLKKYNPILQDRLLSDKYFPDGIYYQNFHQECLIGKIQKKIKRFSERNKMNAFYKAKNLINNKQKQ